MAWKQTEREDALVELEMKVPAKAKKAQCNCEEHDNSSVSGEGRTREHWLMYTVPVEHRMPNFSGMVRSMMRR